MLIWPGAEAPLRRDGTDESSAQGSFRRGRASGQPGSGRGELVMNRLGVVAVQVANEHRGVAGVVLGPHPGRMQVSAPAKTASWCTRSTAARSGAVNATWISRLAANGAGPSQNRGMPSGPDRPTTRPPSRE